MDQPRYLLHEAVGVGGMGVVYRGTLVSPAGERAVAIKQVAELGGIDSQRRARLIAEARLVFRLTHANICQVLDLGEGERGTFVVMELVRGCDLRELQERLAERGDRLDAACALYVAREVARGLDYAHRFRDETGVPLGLVHGDVTPQNVLLSVEGEVKLADFGIAQALDEVAPGSGLRAGTPGYAAPELACGRRDHRLDIYTLGLAMVVTLTGVRPDAALGCLPRLCALRPDVTETLKGILLRATAVRPEHRYSSAGELEGALSTELARRHPTFTPSLLAKVVRMHALERRRESRSHGTLRSMTLIQPTIPDPRDAIQSPTSWALPLRPKSSQAPNPDATKTVNTLARPLLGSRPLGRRIAAAVAVTALVTGGLWLRHRVPSSVGVGSAPFATQVPAELPPPIHPSPESRVALAVATPPTSPGGQSAHTTTPRRRRSLSPSVDSLLSVNAKPWGAVLVDGRQIASETPLYRHSVSAGDHTVVVRFGDGTKSAPQRVRLAPGELRTLGFAR